MSASFATNAVSVLPPLTTIVLGMGSPLGDGSALTLVVKLIGSTVVSTSCADAGLVEPAVVLLGLILSVVKGTGSVLVMDILDPVAGLFDDISTSCTALVWLGPVVAIASG